MSRVRKGDTTAPAETNDPVFLLRCWQRHSIPANGVQLPLNPRRVERSNRGGGQGRNNTIRTVGKILHREKIRRYCDEAISRKLVSNAADPRRQTENLVNDYYDRGLGAPLWIHDPRAEAISIARPDRDPLAVPRRSTQPGGRARSVGRQSQVTKADRDRGIGDADYDAGPSAVIVRIGRGDQFVARARRARE
jgi:hypothetical protein